MTEIDILNEVNNVVADIINLDFQVVKTQGYYVPGYEDAGLSFEGGKAKRAKTMCTCVLYADIRNSTALSHMHSHETMARLYTAFTKSILRVAEYHGAVVRNIIGDRVMLVFPENDCFKTAIDTAISINTLSKYIINKQFKNLDFKVGIGIDYGEMMIVKAGIPKKEPERTNYKNLIWIGKPANIASKLTDVANKEVKKTFFKVHYYPYNWPYRHPFDLIAALGPLYTKPKNTGMFSEYMVENILSEADFIQKIDFNDALGTTYSDGKFVKFTKEEKTVIDKPILMSEHVFNEYKRQYPRSRHDFYTPQEITINDYNGNVHGGDVVWSNFK